MVLSGEPPLLDVLVIDYLLLTFLLEAEGTTNKEAHLLQDMAVAAKLSSSCGGVILMSNSLCFEDSLSPTPLRPSPRHSR